MIHIYFQKEVGRQPQQTVITPAPAVPKLPNVALQELTDKMTKGQREGIRVWNEMVTTLIDNNLMEKN